MAGGGGTTTATSSTNIGPWQNQQPFLMADYNNAANLYNNNPLNAPTNSTQTQSLDQLSQLGLRPSAQIGQANNVLSNQLNGSYLSPTSNPYLSGMFNAAAQAVTNQYQTATSPETQSLFAAANRTGSGGENNAITQNQLNLGTNLNNLANTFYGGAYNQGVQNQLSAAQLSPTLNQAQFTNPLQALNAGNTQQQLQLAQQMQPWETAQLFQGLIGAPTGQTGTTTSQVPYYSNTAGQLLGGGIGLLGALGQAGGSQGIAGLGSIFGSDIRLKEDIRHIGKTNDGQNLYSFRYKGQPDLRIGLMAHEVEKVHPEAVLTHSSGFKMVDYSKALANA